jgi:hypothetical protein
MDGYIEELWGGQEWPEAGMKKGGGGAMGNVGALKDNYFRTEVEKNVKRAHFRAIGRGKKGQDLSFERAFLFPSKCE